MQGKALLVALLTPFDTRGEVDFSALEIHVRCLRAAGISGYFLCGTTGEGQLLDEDEVIQVTRAVLEAVGRECNVVTQVGRPSTKATLRLMEAVLDAGAHGIAVVTPYYYALTDAGLEAHYRKLLAAAQGRPLYAYTIPRRTGNDLRPDLVRKLAYAGLTGVKDSSRSLERHSEYLDIASADGLKRFEVYMGTDALALEALQRESAGIVSAIANIRPELFGALQSAVEEGRTEAARNYQREINRMRDSLQRGDTISNLKLTLTKDFARGGLTYPTALRSPLGS